MFFMLCLIVLALSIFSVRFWNTLVKPVLEITGAWIYSARFPVLILILIGGSLLLARQFRGGR